MSGVGGVDEVEVHQEGSRECSVVTDTTLTSSSQAHLSEQEDMDRKARARVLLTC